MSKADTTEASGSYRSLLKSTSLLGGATAFNVLLGMGRVKCVALLLGPAGLGMMGAYQSIITVTASLTGMGLAYSGVREVAEARGSGDERRLWDTVATFRRLSQWLGVIGMVGLLALAWPVSQLTFNSGEHWAAIAVLASVVWCSLLSSYHMAIIQSAQEISRLARLNMISGLVGTVVSVACFAMWGQGGVVPALAAGGIVQWSLAWYFARGLRESQLPASATYSPAIAGRLFKFGGIMLALAVMSNLVAFAQRVIVLRQMDERALGLMQAAEALSSLYAGYILGAMGTDLLPRLSAATGNQKALNQLVNEQTVIALLLGTPGVVGTICFSSVAIPLFYAASFEPAVGVLQWMAVGVYGRLLSWPVGYLLLALGDTRTVWLNGLSMVTQLVTIWIALPMFGVMAVGLASIAMYVVYTATTWQAAHRLTGFRWSREACEVMAIGGLAVMGATVISRFLPKYWDVAAGIVLLGATGSFSYRRLVHLTGISFVDRIRGRLNQAVS